MKNSLTLIHLICLLFAGINMNAKTQQKPNVILILTDDLGIGDLACEGNPWIKTPNIDAFYNESVRLSDFHVSPLCAPTRGAIMTGQYPVNNGVWATFKGRDALNEKAITMADVFKYNGYHTAMFGKWHLGDNYPSRPTDSGFETVIQHLAGGVGELSDHWGNTYFDDVYYVNNEAQQFTGYCTDVWFSETQKYIEQKKDKPFFIYLPTNAPHDPLIVAEKYEKPYQHLEGKEVVSAKQMGMIANIDENMGRLTQFLIDNNLADNTIVIFMSDNGSRYGYSNDGKLGYNKNFRGIKGSKLEGGHRVPFYIRWPEGNIGGGKDISQLSAHVDILPTLAALCNIELAQNMDLDGIDVSDLLRGKKNKPNNRSVFVHHRQDWRAPEAVNQTCIMKDSWRLINGKELYDIEKDPSQRNNVAAQYPELVTSLLQQNKKFIEKAKLRTEYQELPVNIVGNAAQEEIKLTVQHAIGDDRGIWKCEQVAEGLTNKNNKHAIGIEKDGLYEISLCRWPKECPGAIWSVPAVNKNHYDYTVIKPTEARIKIQNREFTKAIKGNEEAIVFKVHLKKGHTILVNDFIEADNIFGAYYSYVKYIGN